ncbi:hypothetical protein D1007_29509 [Hordeum vulgare]|nr:hypothetical protein D1007_29509 [Hordeum vulgare]
MELRKLFCPHPLVRVRLYWEPIRSGRKINNRISTPKSTVGKAEDMSNGEIKDTASSPLKPPPYVDMDMDKSSRKRLNMDGVLAPPPAGPSTPAGDVLLLTDGKVDADSASPSNTTELQAMMKGLKLSVEHSNATFLLQYDYVVALKMLSHDSLNR